ncbi:DNA polymerase Y family protein [Calycomorphotria hydatis]|uniref:DNA polymerase IV n=1 Tax=Calycomorphotria hydatis TaxID=2528027 RepID=A0A517T5Z8_9PLAN|nr:DNA polymerase [Calycomorphotria hydatis]QDT63788.1 DNA polymerase IV [Calycomorphotria hydatis]
MSLNWLFLDMNAFFASAEQQANPALRGKPVAVVPLETDSTCCIAVSYEARKFGIRTGTQVGEAKRRCPQLVTVTGRHEYYSELHEKIVKAVESVIPVEKVWSIDEMACRLTGSQQRIEEAVELGKAAKQAIYSRVGEALRCSVGLATNRILAKVAAGMQKPDGLTVLPQSELPHRLFPLELDDFPGIGPRMLRRLNTYGIDTTEQLCGLDRKELRHIWNGVIGEQWWYWLRGEDVDEPATRRRTVGHQHVLAPEYRNEEGAEQILAKLAQKAAARLRRIGYRAGRIYVGLSCYRPTRSKWEQERRLPMCSDTPTILRAFADIWRYHPRGVTPHKVYVTLYDLEPVSQSTPSLFADDHRRDAISSVMDNINLRFGSQTLYCGVMQQVKSDDIAPMRIAFAKIPDEIERLELFARREGQGRPVPRRGRKDHD